MRIFIFTILLLTELSVCSQIVISGAITETKQENRVQVGDVRKFLFEIKIKECQWNIKLNLDPDYITNLVMPTRDETGYVGVPNIYEAGSDGLNFYFYQSSKKASDELKLKHGIDTTSSVNQASVKGPGSVPFRIDQKIIALWYAYCSNCYFDEVSAGENIFISMQDYGPEFQKYKKPVLPGKVNLYEAFGSNKLPMELVLYEDPDRVSNVRKALGINNLKSNQYLSTQLKVRDFENFVFDGIQVRAPKSTSIINFSLDVKENNELGNKMVSQLEIDLESADLIYPKTPIQPADFIPVLKGRSLYSDLTSYLKGIEVGFIAKDGWPGMDTVTNHEDIRLNIASGITKTDNNFFNKGKYIGILVISAMFTAGYLLLLRKNKTLPDR